MYANIHLIIVDFVGVKYYNIEQSLGNKLFAKVQKFD